MPISVIGTVMLAILIIFRMSDDGMADRIGRNL
jgi:hypothetical protein